MNFVKNIALPNILQSKNAMYEEVDSLLEPSDFDEMNPESTVGLLLGNLNISSFEKTFSCCFKYRKIDRSI